MRKHALLLLSGLLAGLSCAAAQPTSGTPDNDLTAPVNRHQVTCPPPGGTPCAFRKPVNTPYRMLTPGIDLEDIGDQWLVTFAKAPGTTATLRILGANGDLHEVTVRFSSAPARKARAPAKPL
jgi:hypothetical protein